MSTELSATTTSLTGLNNHNETPAGVLGMLKPVEMAGATINLPEVKSMSDGTVCLRLDSAGRALLTTVPPGEIFSIFKHLGEIKRIDENKVLGAEIIAIKSRQGVEGSELIGQMKVSVDRATGQPKRDLWNQNSGQLGVTEKEIAIASLKRMFDPTNGIEGSQMISSLDLTQKVPLDSIKEYGCFSHDSPIKAVSQNILRGQTQQVLMLIDNDLSDWFIRVNLANDPLLQARGFDNIRNQSKVGENILLFNGVIGVAERIATLNPQNFGAGTDPNSLIEPLMKAIINLPEAAGNEVPIEAVRKNLLDNITGKK